MEHKHRKQYVIPPHSVDVLAAATEVAITNNVTAFVSDGSLLAVMRTGGAVEHYLKKTVGTRVTADDLKFGHYLTVKPGGSRDYYDPNVTRARNRKELDSLINSSESPQRRRRKYLRSIRANGDVLVFRYSRRCGNKMVVERDGPTTYQTDYGSWWMDVCVYESGARSILKHYPSCDTNMTTHMMVYGKRRTEFDVLNGCDLVTLPCGTRQFVLDGVFHSPSEDIPAIEWSDGTREFYSHGVMTCLLPGTQAADDDIDYGGISTLGEI